MQEYERPQNPGRQGGGGRNGFVRQEIKCRVKRENQEEVVTRKQMSSKTSSSEACACAAVRKAYTRSVAVRRYAACGGSGSKMYGSVAAVRWRRFASN
ncbi:hypothetical protein NPIL_6651 [Nephila pilipes]|uniref:Uncharacterized protein n=1 Tax=Nephila pilipes TaxID=299642 RepID=A0A8X6QB90_NEPPI|nr:hypothetical protein NPIL_6651 [Nephila pilipes]